MKRLSSNVPIISCCSYQCFEMLCRLMRVLLLALLMGCLTPARAHLFPPHFFNEKYLTRHGFTSPNEHNPQSSEKILEQAPEGIYVSVGTERGLIGAGFTKNPTHIILVDVDPDVVKYNRYNVAMIKLARSREDYLFLRLFATPEELQVRVLNPSAEVRLEAFERELILDQEYFQRWRSYMSDQSQQWLNVPAEVRFGFVPFGLKTYLQSDEAFNKIKGLADQDRIEAHNINFKSQNNINWLVGGIEQEGMRLSVLDVSNAWGSYYTKKEDFRHLVLEFSKVAHDSSLLFMSDRRPVGDILSVLTGAIHWNYSALTFARAEAVFGHPRREAFYRFSRFFWDYGVNGVPISLQPVCERLFKK